MCIKNLFNFQHYDNCHKKSKQIHLWVIQNNKLIIKFNTIIVISKQDTILKNMLV